MSVQGDTPSYKNDDWHDDEVQENGIFCISRQCNGTSFALVVSSSLVVLFLATEFVRGWGAGSQK